jgi:hypothetical protein
LGGISHFRFSSTGFDVFASWFSILLIIFILAWPFILKIDFKPRYSKLLNDIKKTIEELNNEE